MMQTFDRAAIQYVKVPITVTLDGAPQDPTADTVKLALVASGTHPVNGDYAAGDWETAATSTPPTYYARRLVDFAAVVAALSITTFPAFVDVFWWIVDNPEQPRDNAGPITIT